MKIIKKSIEWMLIVIMLLGIMPVQAYGSTNQGITITIDGKVLTTEVAPIIRNGRTMVPFRRVFEALNAEVAWNEATQTVTGTTKDATVVLKVNQKEAYVNGKSVILDEPPLIIEDRVLVPVRFVAESLGATVNWIGQSKTVQIFTKTELVNEKTGAQLRYGMTKATLITEMGEPQRIDLSQYGFYWYIYKKDYLNYIQVGVNDDKVVAFSVFSENWVIEETGLLRVGKLKNEIPTNLSIGNNSIVCYYDNYTEYGASDVELLAFELLPKGTSISYSEEVLRGWDKEIFDQTNALRAVQNGLAPFSWSDAASTAAKKHSKDMATQNYFSHTSLSGLTVGERLNREGISYSLAAENISAGYYSASEATIGWWNSLQHRKNMLGSAKYLGVGSYNNPASKYKLYFTQDYYTPSK